MEEQILNELLKLESQGEISLSGFSSVTIDFASCLEFEGNLFENKKN